MFQNSFSFTEILRGRYRDFPCIPCPHAYIALLIINIFHQDGTFFTINELTLIYYNHPKSIVYIRVNFCCWTFCGCRQIFNDIYPPLQEHAEQIYCPKNPPCLPIHPFTYSQPLIFFTVSSFFPFPEYHTVAIIQYVVFSDLFLLFSNIFMSFHGLIAFFFFFSPD